MPNRRSAFTLLELLVVIAIVAILAGILVPTIASVQTAGRKVQSLSNMRQLGTALMLYCGQNNGLLPTEGEQSPTWASAAQPTDANTTAWYNALPRTGNFSALADFSSSPANFYTKANLLYVPAAVYPSNKLSTPLFAVAFCSKLAGTFGAVTIDPSQVKLQNFQAPARTVIFQESGIPGEKQIAGQTSAYNGQTKSFASRSVARYSGKTIIVLADGHAETFLGSEIVSKSTGKAYFPQSDGRVSWTMDPSANPN